ncbi:MAG: hypothetical protein D3925_09150, partial [Candidatus Electrothrix sp. AR5]|nr:hypothetical protein [Candidatus Electrothrix sp. AR5]
MVTACYAPAVYQLLSIHREPQIQEKDVGTIKTIISMIAGGILFVWIFADAEGLFFGMIFGFLLARSSIQKNLLKRMEKRLEEHETLLRPFAKSSDQTAASAQSLAKKQKEQGAVHHVHQTSEAAKPEVTFVPAETTADDKIDGKAYDKIKTKQSDLGRIRPEPDKSVSTPSFVPSSKPPTKH